MRLIYKIKTTLRYDSLQLICLWTVFLQSALAQGSFSLKQMQEFAEKMGITNTVEFGSGIVGTKNAMYVYIADKRKVPDFQRLNWELVKILSERFSCLAVAKQDRGEVSTYTCRSGATIDIKRSQSQQFVYFVAKERGQRLPVE